jgi:hypothetical protein
MAWSTSKLNTRKYNNISLIASQLEGIAAAACQARRELGAAVACRAAVDMDIPWIITGVDTDASQ